MSWPLCLFGSCGRWVAARVAESRFDPCARCKSRAVWWRAYQRWESRDAVRHGMAVKEAVRFFASPDVKSSALLTDLVTTTTTTTTPSSSSRSAASTSSTSKSNGSSGTLVKTEAAATTTTSNSNTTTTAEEKILALKEWLFYVPKDGLLYRKTSVFIFKRDVQLYDTGKQ